MDPFNTYTRQCGKCFTRKKLRGGKTNQKLRTFTCAECIEKEARRELEQQLRGIGTPASA